MYQGYRILALIIARGGSKGLPGKNLMTIDGKSMLEFSYSAAEGSSNIDRIILSTDDSEIIAEGQKLGIDIPFVRPAELSTDDVSGNKVVVHALKAFPEYDYVVLLQPTSPLRTTEDIDAAIEMCINKGIGSCVSVTPVTKSPFWMYQIDADGMLSSFLNSQLQNKNRQQHPSLYVPNGAIYVAKCTAFNRNGSFYGDDTIAYVMPPERSVDIDNQLDFLIAKMLIEERNKNR